ncbi:MAG: DinB family protein [Chloroflexi bacterium]|nr:DinB family protein [Chloroflexota bacterium]
MAAGSKAQEIIADLEQSQAELLKQVEGITRDELAFRPGEEEWTIGQLLGHLPYWEKWYISQVEQTLGTGQGEWQEGNQAPETTDSQAALSELKAVRARSIARIGKLSDADLATSAVFGGYGRLTVGELLGKMTGHEHEHAAQIAANRRQSKEK